MKNIILIFVLMLSLGSESVIAQMEHDRHFNTWWTLKVKTDINDRFYVNSQISLRRYDGFDKWEKIQLRSRGLYQISEFIVAGFGYTYSRNYSPNRPHKQVSIPRSDIFTEIGFMNKFDKLKLINRFRLDHRFTGIMVIPEDSTEVAFIEGIDFTNRIRYRVTFKHPILEENGKTKIYAAGFYELFLGLTNKFQIENIKGNVFKLVAGYSLSDKSTLELGFRRQIKLKKSFTVKEINTVLDVALKYRFDGRRILEQKLFRYLSKN